MKFAQLSSGLGCYYQHWFPKNPRALVVMVHGLGDHIGRYNEFVSFMSCKGYACALYDQRGHGLSEGKRGHIKSFNTLIEDLDAFFEFTCDRLACDVPIFLLGGSLGGLIVISYALKARKNLAGLIAASAAIQPNVSIPEWQKKIIRKIGKLIPSYSVHNGLEWENMTRDPDEMKYLMEDRLFHRRITLGSAIEIEQRLQYVMTLPYRIYVPMLLLVGSNDRICAPIGSRRFVDRLSSSDKECIVYDGMLHDILHDVGRRRVMEDIEGWVSKRVGNRQPVYNC